MENAHRPTWRKREQLRARKTILSAAKRIFAKRGFHKSTLSDIANEAQLGKGTIYSYFTSKADLVRAVFDDTIEEQLRIIGQAVRGPSDPASRIRTVARVQLTHFARNRYLLRICATETVFQNEVMKKKIRSVLMQKYARYTELLEEIFADGIKRGQFKKVDTARLSHLFIAIMHSVCWYWEMYGVKPAPEREARFICEIVLEGLKKGR